MNKQQVFGIIPGSVVTALLIFSFPIVTLAQENIVPSWIKNTAGFWANGDISDNEFLNAIEFLINNEVIHVTPSTSQAEAQMMVYTISDTYPIWGITSSQNGHMEELYCKGNDVALSAGFEVPFLGIYPGIIKPIESVAKTGYAFSLVNFASDESGGNAVIYVTCMAN